MQAVEDHGTVAGPLLPRREAGEIGGMVVGHDGAGFINKTHATPLQPVAELDVLPRRIGKTQIERLRQQQISGIERFECTKN